MVRISKSPNAAANPLSDPAGFPVITYGMGTPLKIRMNGEVVDLIPIRAAHTGGDTIIRFENANVIMIGDFYRNYGYPYIDIANGGSLKGMLEGLDATMELAGPDTKLVPGHGTIIKRDDIVPYRDMIFAVRGKGAAADRAGQNRAGRAGRESHRALRREGSRRTSAGRCRNERRPVRLRGVSGTQGRELRRLTMQENELGRDSAPAGAGIKALFHAHGRRARASPCTGTSMSRSPSGTTVSRSTRRKRYSTLGSCAARTAADAPGPDRSIAW